MQLAYNKEQYNEFREFLQETCGILLGENKAYLVESRLKPLSLKYQIPSLSELVEKIKKVSAADLREEVIDAMTTNETLWFRDDHPFRILSEILLPELGPTKGQSPVKIWSAACSTGQEPYSIAITAREFSSSNPGKLPRGVDIVASDISPSVVNSAKKGIYEMLALGRGMSEQRLTKCFNTTTDKSWAIKQEYKSCVDFKTLNLMEKFTTLGTKFDIIYCRNVLIYFSQDLKIDILSRMHQMLHPGGYLILGASESLNGLSNLYDMVQCKPGLIYKAK